MNGCNLRDPLLEAVREASKQANFGEIIIGVESLFLRNTSFWTV